MIMEDNSESHINDLAKRAMIYRSEILPDHPQAQLQAKLLALARSRAPPPAPQSPAKSESESKKIPKRRRLVAPVVQLPECNVQQKLPPAALPRPTLEAVKAEPLNLEQQCDVQPKESAAKKQKQCNCKNSRCLKLYCECFASGIYCNGCNCNNCHNNVENEIARKDAIEATLERNPNAFKPKITKSPHGSQDGKEENAEDKVLVKHNKGCNCKKTECLKKYCECYQAGVSCSKDCKCIDCKNFEGSNERRALFNKNHINEIVSVNQAANAAINGPFQYQSFSTSQTTNKGNNRQLMVESTSINQCAYRIAQELPRAYPVTSSMLLTAPGAAETCPMMPRSLNSRYRSSLAGIIKPEDVKELCSVLVMVSAEVTKTLAENRVTDRAIDVTKVTTSLSLSNQESTVTDDGRDHDQELAVNNLVGDQRNSCRSDGDDFVNERALSPETVSLMCDEQDLVFLGTRCTSPVDSVCGEDSVRNKPEGYAEQEKLVLTNFLNFLNRVITRANIKEMCSPTKGISSQLEHPT